MQACYFSNAFCVTLDPIHVFCPLQAGFIVLLCMLRPSASWRRKTWSRNLLRLRSRFQHRNQIGPALLDVHIMIGINWPQHSKDLCTMLWQPPDRCGTIPGSPHLHLNPRHYSHLRDPHAQHHRQIHPFHRHHLLSQLDHLTSTRPPLSAAIRLHRSHHHQFPHHLAFLQFDMGTPAAPVRSHRSMPGNPTSTFTTPTRWMVWIFLPASVKASLPASKTSRAWIHCKSLYGSSYTKDFTTHGFVVLPMQGKPSYSHSTTSALQSSSLNWWRSFAHGTWIWTSWQHTNLEPQVTTSPKRKQVSTWLRRWLSWCNLGCPRNLLRTQPANNAFLNWRLNWPRWNPRTKLPQQRQNLRVLYQRQLDVLLLVDNQPTSLTETQYKKWPKDLKLPPYKMETLEKELEKVTTWWNSQPDESSKTIQRASVAMGIDPCKLKNASTDEIVLKVMTVSMLMNSWLGKHLTCRDSKAARIMPDLAVAHACILSLALLTSLTL